MKYYISYKTKIDTFDDGTEFISPKKRLTRRDCNLKPIDNDYYNSDLFEGMLNGFYKQKVGSYNLEKGSVISLSKLIDSGFEINRGKFLSEIKLDISDMQGMRKIKLD